MKVVVLGGGNVGGGLAARWRAAGHEVELPGRDPGRQVLAVDGADAVLLAVPASVAPDLVAGLASELAGKPLIDATNDVTDPQSDLAGVLAAAAPAATVVKAFNTVFAAIYADVDAHPGRADMVYCGADDEAKARVAELITDAGFRPVDCGGLDAAPDLEGFARLVIRTAYRVGRGPFGYRLAPVPDL